MAPCLSMNFNFSGFLREHFPDGKIFTKIEMPYKSMDFDAFLMATCLLPRHLAHLACRPQGKRPEDHISEQMRAEDHCGQEPGLGAHRAHCTPTRRPVGRALPPPWISPSKTWTAGLWLSRRATLHVVLMQNCPFPCSSPAWNKSRLHKGRSRQSNGFSKLSVSLLNRILKATVRTEMH